MKRVLSVLLATLFLLTALPMLALAETYTVTVTHNDGGITGYNTIGSSTDFTEIASGGTFEAQAGGGLTVAALPDEGNTVTAIYRDREPIDPNLVYITGDGLFVVDHGDVNANEEIEFVFASSDGNQPFDARGQEPGGGPGGEVFLINVFFNEEGGTVGYNTYGSSTDFTALASGDEFEVHEHSGMTIGALPNAGYTVTEIYLDDQPMSHDWVYTTEEGRFVVDNGDITSGHDIRFVFDTDDHDPFDATGAPPFGPGGPGEPDYNASLIFTQDERFSLSLDATFGGMGIPFIDEEGRMVVPCTSGADVRVVITPNLMNDTDYGDYYPHLGSLMIADGENEEFRPYYRMNDVTDSQVEGRFVYETTIQNVQGEMFAAFTEDEWHGHIINEVVGEDLQFLKEDRQMDSELTIDLTTGEMTYLPGLANLMGGKGVYTIGDLPQDLADDLIALGYSADDDFIEVTENEFGDAVNVTLLLNLSEPFHKDWIGDYGEWHEETFTVKFLINTLGVEPDFENLDNELVQECFDRADNIGQFRFDYFGIQANVQRRDVLHISLHTEPNADGVLYGDVNHDGDVNMKDVLLLRKVIAHLAEESEIDREAADVDFDGDLTMKDVLLIRKFIAHLIERFEPPAPADAEPSLEPFELPPMDL